MRLAHAVTDMKTPAGGKPLPFLSLDHVDPGMGRLLPGAEPEERLPTVAGMLEAMPQDVLFGKLRPYLAKTVRVEEPSLVSGEFIVMRPTADTDSRWLAYLTLSTPLVNWAVATSEGVKMPRTTWERVREFRFPARPLQEQRAIADFLDAETLRIDALIGKRRLALVKFDARRQATYFAGVAGLLTAPDQPRVATTLPWLPATPESWSTALLKLLATLGSGHTPSRSHPEWWVAGDCVIPWITTGEVAQIRSDRVEEITGTRERISAAGLANSAAELHPAGTVVLSRTASVGFSAIMGTAMATSQDFATWTCGPLLRPRFLLLCLRAMRGDLLGRLAIGSTHKTIYMPDIESIRVPVPLIAEQDRIVDAVHEQLAGIDHSADMIGRQIRLLRERRQALITAAVTGEIDVSRGAA